MKVEVQKLLFRGIKYILAVYALLSLIYTSVRLYQRLDPPSLITTSRRSIVIENQPVHQKPIQTKANDVIQSKMFSGIMGQPNISPYYFKATQVTGSKDITLSTIVTNDRFPVLSRLASHYKGPISATVYINGNDNKDTILQELSKTYRENPDMKKYVDIHLILDAYDRQFNMWRNVARLYARTDYIMMLDIDFFPCTDFRQEILNDADLLDRLDSGRTALVIPAFEYTHLEDGMDYRHFPRTKADLIQQVQKGKLGMFHRAWQRGHGSTDYVKWYNATAHYRVVDYNYSYEPYVIFKRQGAPWCDERFIGYGANKAACLYELYVSGIGYDVLPNHFLIHQSHDYPESTRRKERLFNRKLYTHFREEVCLRYARQFIADDEWDTARADNLKNECQKIRGFVRTMQ
ncbi:hypothetical protein G6F43_006793 [Rhizopus delemar]|nr:hypothetical protein G6F43_006793 [Rhizopus delemar]